MVEMPDPVELARDAATARTPEKPVSRSIGTLLAAFGLLAVFMAFAVPCLVDAIDHRIQSPLDVEAAIGAARGSGSPPARPGPCTRMGSPRARIGQPSRNRLK